MRIDQRVQRRFLMVQHDLGIRAGRLFYPVIRHGGFVDEAFEVLLGREVCFQHARGVHFRVGFCCVAAGVFENNCIRVISITP